MVKHMEFGCYRSSAYAKVIAEELPDAMQVADRFHLHQNLLEAVKKALNHELPAAINTGEKEKENRAKRLAFRGRYVVDIHFKQLRCAFTITLYWPAKQFIPKAGERQLPLQKADRREL